MKEKIELRDRRIYLEYLEKVIYFKEKFHRWQHLFKDI